MSKKPKKIDTFLKHVEGITTTPNNSGFVYVPIPPSGEPENILADFREMICAKTKKCLTTKQ